jgi:hypothetical protein
MLSSDYLGYLIGGGVPLFFIFILIRWTLKRQDTLKEDKKNFLKSLANQFTGELKSYKAEFTFKGSIIQAYFVDPVPMGSGEYLQTVPGYFAVKCEILTLNSLISPLIIKNDDQLIGKPFREPAMNIFKNNFDEIEIDSQSIQVRKMNVVLSEQTKENLLKELESIIPSLIQIQKVIR